MKTLRTERMLGAVVEDVVYGADTADIGEVEAFLVRPADGGSRAPRSCAAILFWHWLDGEAPDGNRTEFRDEAASLANLGVVSLLPQGRFPWTIDPSGAAADTAQIELEVARLVAGLDVLAARPEVDPGRIAVVGHDFGGMYAILATATDPRVRSIVVIAATPRWSDWFLPFWQIDEDRLDYLRAIQSLDPIEQMAAISPRPVLLQFGQRDFYVAPMSAFGLRRAAGGDAVELKMYDAEHDMRHPDARSDRLAFLSRTLELEPSPSV